MIYNVRIVKKETTANKYAFIKGVTKDEAQAFIDQNKYNQNYDFILIETKD